MKDGFLKNIADVIAVLKTGETLQNKEFKSFIGTGKTDVWSFGDGTKMSYNVFLLRLLQDASLVSRLDPRTAKTPETKEVESVSRLKQFLMALEMQHPDKQYKNTFYAAHRCLDMGP